MSPNVSAGNHDFESAALHELGHCAFGLGHINEPKLIFFLSGFTEMTPGPNGNVNQSSNFDGIEGSSDDDRGDDINLLWFRRDDNNPFGIDSVVDSTTYSRLTSDLPTVVGEHHKAAQNANASVARNIFSLFNAQGTMFSTRNAQEESRELGFDDVATVRYAQSGLDELQGTDDDYTIQLELIGKTPTCQVVVRFETPSTGTLGLCEATLPPISGNHSQLGPLSIIRINPDPSLTWFFGDSSDLSITISDGDGDGDVSAGEMLAYTIEVVNIGQEDPTGSAEIVTTVPDNTSFDAALSSPLWNCTSSAAGSPCTLTLDVPAGAPPQQFAFAVIIDDPVPVGVSEITLNTQVTAPGGEGNPSDNSAMENTPIVLPADVFDDGFETGDTTAWTQTIP